MNALSTTLRAAGVIAVLLLAAFSILCVLGLITPEVLAEMSLKSVLVIGILAATGFVISLLLRKRGA